MPNCESNFDIFFRISFGRSLSLCLSNELTGSHSEDVYGFQILCHIFGSDEDRGGVYTFSHHTLTVFVVLLAAGCERSTE